MIRIFVFCSFVFLHLTKCSAIHLESIFEWNSIDYEWPNTTFRNNLNGFTYIPQNNLPFGIARWKDKVFITVPRWKYGVFSTLNYVEIGENKSPALKPYPSIDKNIIYKHSNNSIASYSKEDPPFVSVFRVFVDDCDRLWVLDNGIDGIFDDPVRIAQRTLYIYDLKTDELIRRYEFKETDFSNTSSFAANVIVDVNKDSCEKAFAYCTDVSGFNLVVYDFEANDSWRISRIIYFYPNPDAGQFSGDGFNVFWIDGILGLSLGKREDDGYRNLYFHPLTSFDEFVVSTKYIQNKNFVNDKNSTFFYKKLGYRGPNSQSTTSCYDDQTGVIFYAEMNRHAVGCWNTSENLAPEFVGQPVKSTNRLNTPADIKIDNERQLWVLSNRLVKYLYNGHDQNEINYRVFKFQVDELIKGTVCE